MVLVANAAISVTFDSKISNNSFIPKLDESFNDFDRGSSY